MWDDTGDDLSPLAKYINSLAIIVRESVIRHKIPSDNNNTQLPLWRQWRYMYDT